MAAIDPNESRNAPLNNVVTDEMVAQALDVVRKAVASCSGDATRVGVSFNGGKDAMLVASLTKMALPPEQFNKLKFFVFEDEQEFPELREFRKQQAREYLGVDLVSTPGPIRPGLWRLHRDYNLVAAIVGMRRADPSGSWLKAPVTRCTEGWPPMTLFLPVLEWNVQQVWDFTLRERLPYCALYAKGYTSLGPRHETVPNPALRDPDTGEYRPAWDMEDCALERASRATTSVSSNQSEDDSRSEMSPTSPNTDRAARL